MPLQPLYPPSKRTNRRRLAMALALLSLAALPGCGTSWVNPNFMTIVNKNQPSYTISGLLTRGNSAYPKVAYIQGEGDTPDNGSFRTLGPAGAGITSQGIYTPTALVPLDYTGRFTMTFNTSHRYALVRVFAWDDVNRNGIRDTNERIATEFTLEKQDVDGWSFNAPDWNQFNFVFE